MIRKIGLLIVMVSLVFTYSCKNENASSKINPDAKEIAPADPNYVSSEPTPTTVTPIPTDSQVATPVDGKYPEMAFEKSEHDFGNIKQGDKVSYSFKFKNKGESDLIISDAKGTCGCTVPEYPKTPIKPGESGKIKVTFDSNGKTGSQAKSVTIFCNTKKGQEILNIKSNVEVPEGTK